MKKNIVLFGLVAIAFAAAGIFFAGQRSSSAASSAAVANLMSQSLNDAGGQARQLSQWKDRVLLVNFWATWCNPCVDEMPELSALQKEIEPAGMQILGIG